jgi:predicted membrane chloride channel (bestrophin family)
MPVPTGKYKEGLGWHESEVSEWACKYSWAESTEGALMNLTETLEKQYIEAEKLWGNYKAKLDAFRGQVKNDVVSLNAQARQTTDAAHKMQIAFNSVIAELTSENMKEAIENAERLAAALAALNAVKPHKLMFATVDTKEADKA